MTRVKEQAKKAKKKAETLPLEFKFYCPRCLYQTNEESVFCPACGTSKLLHSEQKKDETPKKEVTKESDFKYYCPSCLHQTNKERRICPKCADARLKRVGEE